MAVYDALTFTFAMLSFLIGLVISFFAYPEITTLFVIFGYYFSFFVVAQTIGEEDGWHVGALRFYFAILIIIVNIFAVIYWRYGLLQNGSHVDINYLTSLYFSITTWTTLGYGDFAPVERIRHITSIQALLGYVGLGVFITLAAGYINNMATNRKAVNKHNRKLIQKQSKENENS